MKGDNAIVAKRISTYKHFAWFPVRLENGNLTWLKSYYEEVYFYSSGFGYRQMASYYFTKDEYMMRKLSGV
jgi:hypothetical protein